MVMANEVTTRSISDENLWLVALMTPDTDTDVMVRHQIVWGRFPLSVVGMPLSVSGDIPRIFSDRAIYPCLIE